MPSIHGKFSLQEINDGKEKHHSYEARLEHIGSLFEIWGYGGTEKEALEEMAKNLTEFVKDASEALSSVEDYMRHKE